MAKVKLKKMEICNDDEFMATVNRVAMLETEHDAMEARYTLLEQRLKARRERCCKPLEQEKVRLLKAAAEYADAHQDTVLEKGKRSGETKQATYGFRMGNPAVAAAKGCTLKAALEALLKKGRAVRERFLIFPPAKLYKDAIREQMKPKMMQELGLEVVQEDSFYVTPKGKEKGGEL